jgi:hypothetical protein
MKKLLIAALLTGAAMPASAAPFVGNFTFDMTATKDNFPSAPTVTHLGLQTIEVSGLTPGLLNSSAFSFSNSPCVACISYIVSGDVVQFRMLPAFRPGGSTMGFNIQFDIDLGGDLANAVGANVVAGGAFITYARQGSIFNSASGPLITGWTAAVPEPASWSLMIGGFGAIGGAMRYRRRKVNHSFA